MAPITLDLDNIGDWPTQYDQILYAEDFWSALEADLEGTCEMMQELLNDPADIRNPILRKAQHECDEVFRSTYGHVTAYHACRSVNPSAYRHEGLLTSSRKRLESMAREVFADHEHLEEAISSAESYFTQYDESISLYISANFAATEYLKKGSHYLRMVAANLGEGNQCLLRRREAEQPVFVKCMIPVTWLDDPAVSKGHPWAALYNAALMRRVIWAKTNSRETYDEAPAALVIWRAIPPNMIQDILTPEVCKHWTG